MESLNFETSPTEVELGCRDWKVWGRRKIWVLSGAPSMQVWTKPQLPEIKLQQDTGIVLSGETSRAGMGSRCSHLMDVMIWILQPQLAQPNWHSQPGEQVCLWHTAQVEWNYWIKPLFWSCRVQIWYQSTDTDTKELLKEFSFRLFLFCWSTGNGNGEIWTQTWTSSWNIINYSHRKSTRTKGLQTLEPFTPLT